MSCTNLCSTDLRFFHEELIQKRTCYPFLCKASWFKENLFLILFFKIYFSNSDSYNKVYMKHKHKNCIYFIFKFYRMQK